jgi:tetratricopeptide (TPR) repeat protein
MKKTVLILLMAVAVCGVWGQSADEYQARGLAYLVTDHYDEAIADFTELIKLNPPHLDKGANGDSHLLLLQQVIGET